MPTDTVIAERDEAVALNHEYLKLLHALLDMGCADDMHAEIRAILSKPRATPPDSYVSGDASLRAGRQVE